jgi:NADH-quinone oxidoreductase subunit N
MGFMLLGLLAGVVNGNFLPTANAYSSALFYAITYVITTLATFGVIMLISRSGFEAENIEDFKGLNQRSPWFAAIMLLAMFSLAGLPPLMGFYAKLSVLQALAGTGNQLWLMLIAVLCSLIGAFYYLRIIKLMYFDDSKDLTPITAKFDFRLLLSLNGLVILAFGIWPSWLMNVTTKVIVETLAAFFSRIAQ